MYRNILVAVDADDPVQSADALRVAVTLARSLESKLTICSVVRDVEALARGEWLPISYEQLLFETRAKLDTIGHALGQEINPKVEVATGTIHGGVLEVAERIEADLIILASHRPGAVDYMHAANAARIARRATCSVLNVRPCPSDPKEQKRVRRRIPRLQSGRRL